jgi:ABC-type transport system involved in multi-copper enzyme maturation permease subunit
MAFFSLMVTAITFLAEGDIAPGLGSVVDITGGNGLVAGVITATDMLGIVALSLWASAAAADFSTGWIRVLVQAEPRRWRLFAAKLIALVGYTIAGTAIATVLSIAVAPSLASTAGVATSGWDTSVGVVLGAWANLSVAVIGWGAFGIAVAMISRSVVIAIAGGIGYLMVFEGLLGLIAESATTYLPGSVLTAVAQGGTADLAYGNAIVITGVYVAAVLAIAVIRFTRRDITS